jgi:hypothetical protein
VHDISLGRHFVRAKHSTYPTWEGSCTVKKITTALTMVANERIIVPERAINGGFDCKWASDPYNVKLYDIMTSQDYEDAITRVNDTVKPSRSKKIDAVLLFTGPLMVPLGIWGVRHSGQVKKRKKLLKVAIEEFN